MANTLDIMISCFGEECEAISYINRYTKLGLTLVTDSSLCGGTKTVIFESYGSCLKSGEIDDVNYLLDTFREAPWEFPSYAVLLIDDDDERINGLYSANK